LANHTAPWKICGRQRWGWKREFLESLAEAAKDIGEISQEENLPTVRSYRRESRAPEITVAAELEGASRGPSFDTSVLAAGISGF
jgi:HEAT repeat protein